MYVIKIIFLKSLSLLNTINVPPFLKIPLDLQLRDTADLL